jgi:hypothetical protein
MVEKLCEICGSAFSVKPYREKTARFCSRSCRAKWVSSLPHACGRGTKRPWMQGNTFRAGLRPTNAFEKGHEAWNKGMKGIHLSPHSEFKRGREAENKCPVGTVRIRTYRGVERAWEKIAEPNTWELRARVVWREANGPIPRGMVIHHHDRNPLNDELENLACLTKAEHAREHAQEVSPFCLRARERAELAAGCR